MNSNASRSPHLGPILAATALAFSCIALWRSTRTHDAAPPVPAAAPRDELGAFAARLDALEARPIQRTAESAAGMARSPALDQEALTRLDRRITALEAGLRQISEQVAAIPRGAVEPTARPTAEEQRAAAAKALLERTVHVDEDRQTILSPTSDEAAKVMAWSHLRHAGPDAWTDQVVDEMVRIGLGSADPEIRANVWRQADARSKSPRIVPALLRALATDSSSKAREEAAETLGGYRDEPAVQSALEFAANQDAEQKVRDQAHKSLRQG